MSSKDVRKGMTEAKFNEENASILFGEIGLIAIGLGLFAQSWWVFGGVLLGLLLAILIPGIAIVLMVAFSLAWGAIGYAIGTLFDSFGASVVLCIIGFLFGLGVHLSALEWAQDVGTKENNL